MEMISLAVLLVLGLVAVAIVLRAVSRRGRAMEERVLKEYFLLGLSGLMAKIAMADGCVTGDEADQALGFFNSMKLTDAEKAICIGNFVAARRDGQEARDHANRFMAYASPVAGEILYSLLWRLSAADGKLDPAEDRLLSDIALYLGLGKPMYDRFKAGERPKYDRNALRACGVPEALWCFT